MCKIRMLTKQAHLTQLSVGAPGPAGSFAFKEVTSVSGLVPRMPRMAPVGTILVLSLLL